MQYPGEEFNLSQVHLSNYLTQFVYFCNIHLAADKRPEDCPVLMPHSLCGGFLAHSANGLKYHSKQVPEDEELLPD